VGSQGITGVVEEGSGRFRKARDSAFTHSLPPREVEFFVFCWPHDAAGVWCRLCACLECSVTLAGDGGVSPGADV